MLGIVHHKNKSLHPSEKSKEPNAKSEFMRRMIEQNCEQRGHCQKYVKDKGTHNCVSRVFDQIIDTKVFYKFGKSKNYLSSVCAKICHFREMRVIDFDGSPFFFSKGIWCAIVLTVLWEKALMNIHHHQYSVDWLFLLRFSLLRHDFVILKL